MPAENINVVRATDASSIQGCAVITKTRSVIMQRGVDAVVEWVIRDSSGNPMDLSNYLCNESESSETPDGPSDEDGLCGRVNVRFQDAFGYSNILQDDAVVLDQAAGLVQVEVPPVIARSPNIYRMAFGVMDSDDTLVYVDNGLLSVERSLFSAPTDECGDVGPLTINEIRLQLRDYALSNNLTDNVEFDDTELLHSILQPIRQWNETPPPIGNSNVYNFPYRYNWLKATVANLLRIAANHYLRNDLQASHGGISVADQSKAPAYLQLAQQYQVEWERWLIATKVSINAGNAYGSVGSPYSRISW